MKTVLKGIALLSVLLLIAACGEIEAENNDDNGDNNNNGECYGPTGDFSQEVVGDSGDCDSDLVDDYLSEISDTVTIDENYEHLECGTYTETQSFTENDCTFSHEATLVTSEDGYEIDDWSLTIDCPDEGVQCSHEFEIDITAQ